MAAEGALQCDCRTDQVLLTALCLFTACGSIGFIILARLNYVVGPWIGLSARI